MARARYSIGIDLGTTNSALAFAPLVGDAKPEVLLVPQWESSDGAAEQPTLPAFLYLPEEAVAARFRTRNVGAGEWIVVALTVIGLGLTSGDTQLRGGDAFGHGATRRSPAHTLRA